MMALYALYLGLYGREAMDLIEEFRRVSNDDETLKSYNKLITNIIHRPARESDDPHCSVTLSFKLRNDSVIINRRWNFTRGGRVRDLDIRDGEEVLIEVNERKKAFDSWKDANARIQELIFPCNVMPCLFFDGEQAQARVEAAGGRALFDAVKALYGTGILDLLGDSLRTYISNERQALQRDVGVVRLNELEQKRDELDRLRDDLRKIQDQLSHSRQKRTDSEQERQKLENQLYALVGDKASDVEEYASTVAARAIVKSGVRRVGHAAALLSLMTSLPSVNLTPSTTLASCWKPRSRRQDFSAHMPIL